MKPCPSDPGAPTSEEEKGRRACLSLATVLMLVFGSIVFIAVAIVLAIGLWSARTNTFSLINSLVQQTVNSSVDKIVSHLEPVERQARSIAEAIAAGEISPKNEKEFIRFIRASLRPLPQLGGTAFIAPNRRVVLVIRKGPVIRFDGSRDPDVADTFANFNKGGNWGRPVARKDESERLSTVMNYRIPARRNGKLLGFIASTVRIRDLSVYLGSLGARFGINAFILYGKDRVLAHELLGKDDYPGLSPQNPLPKLDTFRDPVLANIWTGPRPGRWENPLAGEIDGHFIEIGEKTYLFTYKVLTGFADKPLTVGTYYPVESLSAELTRLRWAGGASILALVLALAAALFVARRIARPIGLLAHRARKISELDFSSVPPLGKSRLRELDEQARAFNAMLNGLRWLEIYVPKRLVHHLIRRAVGHLPSEQRNVTVLFTDISGFTRMSEGLPAAEVADFLNRHFAMLAEIVEDEDGMVDKFIGDSLMAFWGAPDETADHADRAIRAALRMREAIVADNEKRRAEGLSPVHLRIGIHTGLVTVGNIGAPGRMNYTIVGDTVNVGQRLEQLGKLYAKKECGDVCILFSRDTRTAMHEDIPHHCAGMHRLPGRSQPIEVYLLES